jgi:hypothetical protein
MRWSFQCRAKILRTISGSPSRRLRVTEAFGAEAFGLQHLAELDDKLADSARDGLSAGNRLGENLAHLDEIGWTNGIAAGAIIAVPTLAITKTICDRVQSLAALGHFLEG